MIVEISLLRRKRMARKGCDDVAVGLESIVCNNHPMGLYEIRRVQLLDELRVYPQWTRNRTHLRS